MQKQRQLIIDEKGRVVLPKRLREQMKVKPGQRLVVIIQSDEIRLKKVPKATEETSQLFWDIAHPARSKVKITRALLEKLKEEQWSGN